METLYCVGVGPGDPELITLKAVRLLREADRIFYPLKRKDDASTARTIVEPHLVGRSPAWIPLLYPMESDRETLALQWEKNARLILDHQRQGGKGVFITLGDPCIYSTFMLTAPHLEENHVPFEVVPGIPSFLAGAATAKMPLVLDDESLLIRPGNDGRVLKETLQLADTVVVMKASMGETLSELGALEGRESVVVERVGMADEKITRGTSIKGIDLSSYFSLVIVKGEVDHG